MQQWLGLAGGNCGTVRAWKRTQMTTAQHSGQEHATKISFSGDCCTIPNKSSCHARNVIGVYLELSGWKINVICTFINNCMNIMYVRVNINSIIGKFNNT
jgi:hypothetical protein